MHDAEETLETKPLSLTASDAAHVEAEAHALFNKIDTDGDGSISLEELRQHLVGQQQPVATELMFAKLDANDDGSISPQEFREGLARFESARLRLALGLPEFPHAPPEEERSPDARRMALSDELFDAVDENGDNALQPKELLSFLKGSGHSPLTVAAIFDALDIKQQGKISREDFRQSFSRYEFPALRLALGLSGFQ